MSLPSTVYGRLIFALALALVLTVLVADGFSAPTFGMLGENEVPDASERNVPKQQYNRIERTGRAYVSKIESNEDEIVKLSNGAIVEVTAGYLGYLGYRKQAVLFTRESGCTIWIEGKKAFNCNILRAPTSSLGARSASLATIAEVKARGKLLVMDDGSIYQVDSVDTITTSLWLGLSDALILDDIEVINLSDGGGIVGVSKIRQ
jgi:hypothetical protein